MVGTFIAQCALFALKCFAGRQELALNSIVQFRDIIMRAIFFIVLQHNLNTTHRHARGCTQYANYA